MHAKIGILHGQNWLPTPCYRPYPEAVSSTLQHVYNKLGKSSAQAFFAAPVDMDLMLSRSRQLWRLMAWRFFVRGETRLRPGPLGDFGV